MEVSTLRATDAGFEAHGEGRLSCSCPSCGQLFAAVDEAFTVECVGIRCPNCRGTDIACTVTSVDRDGAGYAFDGAVTCPDCGHKGAWRKVVSVLDKITRMKLAVGPTHGVEVEVERRSSNSTA
jgi:ssDNA-binding Zn-finger/Zn-ribbon topoisomerase 1